MTKLTEVENARALFIEGKDWSVMRWLTEKRRVREAADRATAALDACEQLIKTKWSEDLKKAFASLTIPATQDDDPFSAAEQEYLNRNSAPIPAHLLEIAKKVKDADDEAYRVRMKAEESFAQAERRLSLSLTKRGAEEAILSYDLSYKAISEAEAARQSCLGNLGK